MSHFDATQPQLLPADMQLLGYLNQKWPASVTVTPHTATFAAGPIGLITRAEFVDMMQTLSDNGLISYEAFLMQSSLGLRFIGTMITARGKSALQAAAVHA